MQNNIWMPRARQFFAATLLVSAACLTFNASGAAASEAEQLAAKEPLKVRFSGYLPIKHYISKGMEDFKKSVEAKSNGSIIVETFPAAQLYKNTDQHQAVIGGQVELGVGVISEFADVVPTVGIVDLPFLVNTSEEMQKALLGDLGARISSNTEKVGLKIIGWADLGFLNALGNNKHPVKKPSDVAGLKIRSFGIFPVLTAQELGAAALNLSSAETYAAIQRGVIDGGLSLATSFYSRKWFEVITDLTIVPLGYVTYAIYANNDWWQKLSDDQKAVLTAAAKEMSEFTFTHTKTATANAIGKMKAAGVRVYTVPPTDYKEWRTELTPVYDAFLKQTGAEGQRLLNTAAKYRQD